VAPDTDNDGIPDVMLDCTIRWQRRIIIKATLPLDSHGSIKKAYLQPSATNSWSAVVKHVMQIKQDHQTDQGYLDLSTNNNYPAFTFSRFLSSR
jgi:hypothetical protein